MARFEKAPESIGAESQHWIDTRSTACRKIGGQRGDAVSSTAMPRKVTGSVEVTPNKRLPRARQQSGSGDSEQHPERRQSETLEVDAQLQFRAEAPSVIRIPISSVR